MDVIHVVNVIPNSRSDETHQDSEPGIAVNPSNPSEIVVTAFTPADTGLTNSPIYFSTDGGLTWQLNFIVPFGTVPELPQEDQFPGDQSIAFATASNELYGAFTTLDDGTLKVFRTNDPTATDTLPTMDPRHQVDQPWVEARTVRSGPDRGKDRLYVAYNDSLTKPPGSPSATVDVCLDAASHSPSFTRVLLEQRSVSPDSFDGFAVRPVAHDDGTVYVIYERWTSGSVAPPGETINITTDIVVARDDNWGNGSPRFGALTDPTDGKAGRIVASGVVITDGASMGQERLNNDLAIAVDPTNSDTVYVAWADNAGPNYTLRVRRSTNRGVDWSGDLLTVENATMTSLAINSAGRVGLMYQLFNSNKWETHFRRTTDDSGTNWDDLTLSVTPADTPIMTFPPYLGDWARVVAVDRSFYGVFCANNTPDPANFPNGVAFQRNHTTTTPFQLLGGDGVTPVAVSIDPFFFRLTEVECVIITDRSTFGKDEVAAMLQLSNPAVISAAFYVIVDGFTANELNISAATFTGPPNVAPSISFNPSLAGVSFQATQCSATDETNLNSPQRFTWTCDLIFGSTDSFTVENLPVTMTASITSTSGATVIGEAVITLTSQPNPYEIDGPTSWLSVDLQVFQVLRGGHLPSTPAIQLTGSPNDFIHDLLGNTGGGYNDPSLPRAPNHPFDLDLVANEDKSAVTLAGSVGGGLFFPSIPVLNFAVARVRYRALTTPASNVRCFFRLFQAATTSTDFQPTSTYATGGIGATKVPLLGVVNGEVVGIPCFAAPRIDPNNPNGLNAQTDPDNVGPLGGAIPPDPSGNEIQVYFGCWLDINQNTPQLPDPSIAASAAGPYVPKQSIQQVIRSQHQCLVAEINLDPPEPQITPGTLPAVSDKLAQRNLNIIGVASPHQVPQTFDIKPTPASLSPGQTPDELLIDWGNVPAGTLASIYLPSINAKTILDMANRMYTRHGLSSSDKNTLTCKARGITYVPVPPGVGSNYAGLLTVNLPATVTRGQEFRVITRQITNISAERPGGVILLRAKNDAPSDDVIEWRRVLGTFQISIPVEARAELLGPEERLLSVLLWIAEAIPAQSRWYPVFVRYLDQIAGRVSALGGDPTQILPSSSGDGSKPCPPKPEPERRLHFTGKIAGLMFDRFGDFEGFLLDTEEGERVYHSREKEMERLAERAWRERLRITVFVERDEPRRPVSLIVREPPVGF
jgi:hypothetical protein